jgi:hypothetical protein
MTNPQEGILADSSIDRSKHGKEFLSARPRFTATNDVVPPKRRDTERRARFDTESLKPELCDEKCGPPLEHAGPLYFESHVYDAIIRGGHVEHCQGRGTNKRIVERLAAQLANRHLDARMAV